MKSTSIVHYNCGIGNFVLYTPALRAFASGDPSGKIVMCLEADKNKNDPRTGSLVDVMTALPFIQEVVFFPHFQKTEYKRYLWNDWAGSGPALDFFRRQNTMKLGPWDQDKVHEIDYYLNIVRKHFKYTGPAPLQMVVPKESEKLKLLDTMNGKKKIVLCNGSYDYLGEIKKWPRFPELAALLKTYYGEEAAIIKVGCWKELEDVKDFDIDFVSKLSMIETAAVIQKAEVFITTDTGNMHVADALKVPMVVIWGGSLQFKNFPVNGSGIILKSNRACAPCQRTGRDYYCVYRDCLNDISTGLVMNAVRGIIGD